MPGDDACDEGVPRGGGRQTGEMVKEWSSAAALAPRRGLPGPSRGHTGIMYPDDPWLEAAASLQMELDVQVRDEAYEVYVAESARGRMVDRVGEVTLLLRCGQVMLAFFSVFLAYLNPKPQTPNPKP